MRPPPMRDGVLMSSGNASPRESATPLRLLSSIKAMLVGGAAVPRAMIAAFEQRHGMPIVQGWGMTETSPVASTACLPHDLAGLDDDERFDLMATAGMPFGMYVNGSGMGLV